MIVPTQCSLPNDSLVSLDKYLHTVRLFGDGYKFEIQLQFEYELSSPKSR